MSSYMQKYTKAFKLSPSSQYQQKEVTSSFKNSGRNQKHAFNSRYQKPMYDLDYTKPTPKFNVKNKNGKSRSQSSIRKNQGVRVGNPEEYSEYILKSSNKNRQAISLTKSNIKSTNIINNNNFRSIELYKNGHQHKISKLDHGQQKQILKRSQSFGSQVKNKSRDQLTATNYTNMYNLNNNTIRISRNGSIKDNQISPQKQKFASQNTFGLSKFQINNTIVGNIENRSSNHIQFSKTINRPQNINKIWYDDSNCLSPLDRQQKQKLSPSSKIHDFGSGNGHQVFATSSSSFNSNKILDKFYDYSPNSSKIIKKRQTDLLILNFNKMKARPGLQIKLGTNLEYNWEKGRSLSNVSGNYNNNNKRPLYQILQGQRKLVFTRQVIDQNKGVYR